MSSFSGKKNFLNERMKQHISATIPSLKVQGNHQVEWHSLVKLSESEKSDPKYSSSKT